jgi:hypothetical protein
MNLSYYSTLHSSLKELQYSNFPLQKAKYQLLPNETLKRYLDLINKLSCRVFAVVSVFGKKGRWNFK